MSSNYRWFAVGTVEDLPRCEHCKGLVCDPVELPHSRVGTTDGWKVTVQCCNSECGRSVVIPVKIGFAVMLPLLHREMVYCRTSTTTQTPGPR
jgi:hypothetical protein